MKKVIAFQGSDAKVGTTMIAQSVAEMIASCGKDIRVFFAACNGRSGTEFVETIGEWIENIRPDLGNRVLSVEELMEHCRQSDNYYLLAGAGGVVYDRRYRPEMVSYLVESVSEKIDLLIADCGCEMDQALAVGAMELADERYCIITQQESSLRRCRQLQQLYERMELPLSGFILNKYTPEALYTPDYVGRRLETEIGDMVMVEQVPGSWRAEAEKRTLLSYGRNDFNESIRSFAGSIMERAGYPAPERQRKGIWKNSI